MIAEEKYIGLVEEEDPSRRDLLFWLDLITQQRRFWLSGLVN